MKTDITYCVATDKCKKRYFCKRYLGNYTVGERERESTALLTMPQSSCLSTAYSMFVDVNSKTAPQSAKET